MKTFGYKLRSVIEWTLAVVIGIPIVLWIVSQIVIFIKLECGT